MSAVTHAAIQRSRFPRGSRRPWLAIPVLLSVTYMLPWLYTPAIGALTVHGYDLAEWMSIHPAVRAEPLLLTTLLLRLPLACIGLWIGWAPSSARWARALGVTIFSLALLPPFEFFTVGRADLNYQQQFALAAGTAVFGLGGVMLQDRVGVRAIRLVGAGILLAGGAAAIAGVSRAAALTMAFRLETYIGWGAPLFVLACILIVVGTLSK